MGSAHPNRSDPKERTVTESRAKKLKKDEALKQKIDQSLDEALEETFPASDPIAPAVPPLDEKKPGEAA
jgi:hypothetical protein